MNRSVRRRIEDNGACQPADHATFVTESKEAQAKAISICENCQVRQDCLQEFFFEAGIVVGGTTWATRQKMVTMGHVPRTPRERIVSSLRQGGVRQLIIDSNLGEDIARQVAYQAQGKQGAA